jgi:RimJ/RimL family protein N-acetyltransferase
MDAGDPFIPVVDARPNDDVWPDMSWPPPAGIRLAGEVVELSPLLLDHDARPLFEALNHDAVWRHLSGRPSDCDAFAETLKKRLAEGRFPWVARLLRAYAGLGAGTLVGTSSYLEAAPRDARLEIGATAYTPAVWSTKVNPDAKLLLLTYAFGSLRAGRVQLRTDVRNVRSQEAIARLGARYEGTLRRYQRRDDGTIRDSVLFSIVAEQWPMVRKTLVARVNAPE